MKILFGNPDTWHEQSFATVQTGRFCPMGSIGGTGRMISKLIGVKHAYRKLNRELPRKFCERWTTISQYVVCSIPLPGLQFNCDIGCVSLCQSVRYPVHRSHRPAVRSRLVWSWIIPGIGCLQVSRCIPKNLLTAEHLKHSMGNQTLYPSPEVHKSSTSSLFETCSPFRRVSCCSFQCLAVLHLLATFQGLGNIYLSSLNIPVYWIILWSFLSRL